MHSADPQRELVAGLQRLGVRKGSALLVNSSLRSLGPIPGGAETVVSALCEAVGPDGVLLMPAFSYATVGPDHPWFDVRETPSCVGALTEFFRLREGTMRSLHPTHSVSGAGERAWDVLNGHALDKTPCGPNSPFSRLRDLSGQILFLGCGLNSNTSMHAVEELVEPPYLFSDEPLEIAVVDPTGAKTKAQYRMHGFAGVRQRYDRLGSRLCSSDMRIGKVGQAACTVVEARPMWAAALKALQEDPLAFVETI